jgi:hypothetical protein
MHRTRRHTPQWVVSDTLVPLCKAYHINGKIFGDNYAGNYPKELVRKARLYYDLKDDPGNRRKTGRGAVLPHVTGPAAGSASRAELDTQTTPPSRLFATRPWEKLPSRISALGRDG